MAKETDASNDILISLLYLLLVATSYVTVVVVLLITLVVFGLTKLVAVYLIRLEHKNVHFLTGMDTLFANGATSHEQCVNAAIYCKGRVDVSRIHNHLMQKMVRLHPRLYSYIEQKYGYKFWLPEENFSVEDHVVWHRDLDVRSADQLQGLVDKCHAAPLPYKSSPWHIDIVQLNYTLEEAKGQPVYCMVCTFHHAIADGHSMLFAFLKAVRDVSVGLPRMPEPRRTQKSVPLTIVSHFKAVAMFPLLILDLFVFQKTTMFEPRVLSGMKHRCTSRNLEVKKIRRIKQIMRTNFSSVLATCGLAALQKHFQKRKIPMPDNIYDFMAFPLRKANSEQVELVNNFVIFPVVVPLRDNTTPKDRLKICKSAWTSDENFAWWLLFDLMTKVVIPITPASVGELVFRRLVATLYMTVAGHDANEFKVFDNGNSMFRVDLSANQVKSIGICYNFFTQGEYIDVTFNIDKNLATKEEGQAILDDVHQELLELDKLIR